MSKSVSLGRRVMGSVEMEEKTIMESKTINYCMTHTGTPGEATLCDRCKTPIALTYIAPTADKPSLKQAYFVLTTCTYLCHSCFEEFIRSACGAGEDIPPS
jgi:hypothetical protein